VNFWCGHVICNGDIAVNMGNFLNHVVGYVYLYKLPYLLDKVLERWCGVVGAVPFAKVVGE
jgi:hypothetical protein